MNEELFQSYQKFKAALGAIQYVRGEAIRRDGAFLRLINYPFVDESVRDRKEFINQNFEEIESCVFESSCIGIVSSFEKIIFGKLPTLYGELRNVVSVGYVSPKPFVQHATQFIRDDVENLGELGNILSRQLTGPLKGELLELIDYRNYLAHGKRFKRKTTREFTLFEAWEILNKVLGSI